VFVVIIHFSRHVGAGYSGAFKSRPEPTRVIYAQGSVFWLKLTPYLFKWGFYFWSHAAIIQVCPATLSDARFPPRIESQFLKPLPTLQIITTALFLAMSAKLKPGHRPAVGQPWLSIRAQANIVKLVALLSPPAQPVSAHHIFPGCGGLAHALKLRADIRPQSGLF
jgi:hypothetical protein